MIRIDESTIINATPEEVWKILRDFNGHADWHPAVKSSVIEGGGPADKIGCVRSLILESGENIREELTALSDIPMGFSYRILTADIPLIDYHAHMELKPVTASARTYWRWHATFKSPPGQEKELTNTLRDGVYRAGFDAIADLLGI